MKETTQHDNYIQYGVLNWIMEQIKNIIGKTGEDWKIEK